MATAMFNCTNIVSRCVSDIKKSSVHYYSLHKVKKVFSKYFPTKQPEPPYNHMCQLGDPVLRTKATPVDTKVIQTHEFQKALGYLERVMTKHKLLGISAPQIGLPWQVCAIEVTQQSLNSIDPEIQKLCEMEIVPLTYFINPKMEIKNPAEVRFVEMCGSIAGFRADVPRAKEVEVKALDRFGKEFTWSAKGWPARIIQHEFDHLQGILYIDKMDRSTFECCFWQEVNLNRGKISLKYYAQ